MFKSLLKQIKLGISCVNQAIAFVWSNPKIVLYALPLQIYAYLAFLFTGQSLLACIPLVFGWVLSLGLLLYLIQKVYSIQNASNSTQADLGKTSFTISKCFSMLKATALIILAGSLATFVALLLVNVVLALLANVPTFKSITAILPTVITAASILFSIPIMILVIGALSFVTPDVALAHENKSCMQYAKLAYQRAKQYGISAVTLAIYCSILSTLFVVISTALLTLIGAVPLAYALSLPIKQAAHLSCDIAIAIAYPVARAIGFSILPAALLFLYQYVIQHEKLPSEITSQATEHV